MLKKNKITKFSDKTTGLLNFADLKKPQYKFLYWLFFGIMCVMSAICLLPTLWVALSGFKTVPEMYAIPPSFFPKSIDLGRIGMVWNKVNIMKYFGNTLVLLVGCLATDLIINGLAGYVLAKLKPIGSRVIETAVFWSMLLPGMSMVPLYMTFVDVPLVHVNLSGNYLPICLMSGANAFNILLFRNFFLSIPDSYLEAARIDGCTNTGIFARIIIPLSKPIIMVVAIYSITGTWGNFMWPYLLLGGTALEPMSVMLFKFSAGAQENEYMLLLMISILPMIIIYFFFSNQIMGGLDVGGIKG